jgi:hydroxymethylglutaryl-CoA lyase
MAIYPEFVTIEEQGPRDGLQSESTRVPTEKKVELIRQAVAAGLRRVQVASFVHPKLVPQMADAEDVIRSLEPSPDVLYSGLVLNQKGVERAADAGLPHIAASISASDTHSRRNANASLEEARARIADMIRTAQSRGLKIRGGVQCAFGCRFEGKISRQVVLDMVKEQLDLGVDEVALADSTGMGHPLRIQEISAKALELADGKPVFLHLHDTEGKGLANALAAMQAGIAHFDTAFAGMGGCPFIKSASGNIATEDLAFMLKQMEIETGIDLDRLAGLSEELEQFFGKSFPGKMGPILRRDDIQVAV